MAANPSFLIICDDMLDFELMPLQRYELEEFIRLSTSGNEQELIRRKRAIFAHWEKVFGNPISKSEVFHGISMIKKLLMRKLKEDYVDSPLLLHGVELDWYHDSARDHPESAQWFIEELMLDPAHVLWRIEKVLDRKGGPLNDVQQLVDQRMWQDLAATLVADELLLEKVLKPAERSQIMSALIRLKTRYFTRVSSTGRFELTDYALKLGAPHKSEY